MNKLLIVAVVILPTFAFAQPAQQSEFTLKVTQSDLDLISEGLQTQPFGKVVPLINKLRSQIAEQQKPIEVRPPQVQEEPK